MDLKPILFILGMLVMLAVMLTIWKQAEYNSYCEANREVIELVKNGSYIPVVNRQGKPCLSPQLQCMNDLPSYRP